MPRLTWSRDAVLGEKFQTALHEGLRYLVAGTPDGRWFYGRFGDGKDMTPVSSEAEAKHAVEVMAGLALPPDPPITGEQQQ